MEKKTLNKGKVRVVLGVTGMYTIWDLETSNWVTLHLHEAECVYEALGELLGKSIPDDSTVSTEQVCS